MDKPQKIKVPFETLPIKFLFAFDIAIDSWQNHGAGEF